LLWETLRVTGLGRGMSAAPGANTMDLRQVSPLAMHADQIVVLDHVIEAGDHASLTASRGRYAALAA
jgi:hypothetical protein